jgi:cytoskeletal protein CcmA (bactofilin family)
MSTLVRSLIVSAFCASLVLVLGSPASAQEGAGEDHVVLTGGLVVAEGETVKTAVVFNGPVRIEGTVSQSLVVFNGRTEISGTVDEDVVVFNGRVTVRSGAEVGGDLFSREDAEIEDGATVRGDVGAVPTRFDFEDTWFPGRIAWWIGYTVSTLVLGFLLLLFAPRLDDAIVGAFRNRRGASIGFGIALFFLIPIAAVLLLVTIVGIPLGLFVLLALALLYTVGYVAGAHALGRMLVKRTSSALPAFLAGLGILRLIAFVPILGGVTWLVASVVGLGILGVAARSRSSTAMVNEPAAPPPPPPSPITQT